MKGFSLIHGFQNPQGSGKYTLRIQGDTLVSENSRAESLLHINTYLTFQNCKCSPNSFSANNIHNIWQTFGHFYFCAKIGKFKVTSPGTQKAPSSLASGHCRILMKRQWEMGSLQLVSAIPPCKNNSAPLFPQSPLSFFSKLIPIPWFSCFLLIEENMS